MNAPNEVERHERCLLEEKFSRLVCWERAKKQEKLLLSALFYSVLVPLLFFPVRRSLPMWVNPISLPAIVFFILAPALLLLRRWKKHESLQSVYLMDKKLGLQERAVTGWEIICANKIGAAERLVLKEAVERLRDIDPRSLLKRRLAWQFFSTPLVFGLWLALLWLDFGAHHLQNGMQASQPDSAAKKLKEFSVSLKEKAESQGLAESLKIAAALKELAEKNLTGRMTEPSLKENLARLVKRIESAERGARKESTRFSGGTEESLADLKAELKTLRPGFSRDFSERETKLGADLLGKINNLPRLREALQRERRPAEEMEREDLKSFLDKLDGEVGKELEFRALVEVHDFIGDLLKEFGEEPAPAEAGITGQAKEGRSSEGEKMIAKGDAPGDEPGTKRDPQTLPPFKGTVFTQLRGRIGEGLSSSVTLRGEAAAGKSHIPQEEVITSYRRHAEEELSSEQIPDGVKEAVKRYFLSLGMGAEKK